MTSSIPSPSDGPSHAPYGEKDGSQHPGSFDECASCLMAAGLQIKPPPCRYDHHGVMQGLHEVQNLLTGWVAHEPRRELYRWRLSFDGPVPRLIVAVIPMIESGTVDMIKEFTWDLLSVDEEQTHGTRGPECPKEEK